MATVTSEVGVGSEAAAAAAREEMEVDLSPTEARSSSACCAAATSCVEPLSPFSLSFRLEDDRRTSCLLASLSESRRRRGTVGEDDDGDAVGEGGTWCWCWKWWWTMSGEEEGEAAEAAAVEEGASACKADSEVEWISHFAGVVFEEGELVAACWCLRGGRDLEGGLLSGEDVTPFGECCCCRKGALEGVESLAAEGTEALCSAAEVAWEEAAADWLLLLLLRHLTVTRPVGSERNHSERWRILSVCFW